MAEKKFVTALLILPERYNADESGMRQPVEDEKFRATAEELAKMFGGGALWRYEEGRQRRGFWWDKGILYEDENAVFEVDIEDSVERRRQLANFARNVLTERFQQEAIYIKFVGPVAALTIEKLVVRRPRRRRRGS